MGVRENWDRGRHLGKKLLREVSEGSSLMPTKKAVAAGGRDEETYSGTPKAYSKKNLRTGVNTSKSEVS